MTRRAGALALVAALVAGTAACATSSEYSWYSSNQDGVRAYFRVPNDWTEIPISDEPDPSRPTPIEGTSIARVVVLDSSSDPAEEHFNEEVPTQPVGMFSVLQLDPAVTGNRQNHDSMSLSVMRTIATGSAGIDPLVAWQNGDATIELIRYQEITTESGLRGVRLTFNWQRTDEWVTIDQAVLVNPTDTKLYRLFVKCESSCFKAHQRQLTEMLDSWQVRT